MAAIVRADSNTWQDVTARVKHDIPPRQLFEMLGWRKRGRRDCGLCKGSSRGTISFSDSTGLWHCHRCHQGGSVIDLIMCAHGVKFLEALTWLATQAGIQLPATARS